MSFLRKVFRSIYLQFFIVACVLWAFHRASPFLVDHYKIKVHIIPKVLPLYGVPDVTFNTWIILPLLAFGIYLYLIRTIFRSKTPLPLPVMLAVMMGLKVMIDISVTMINGGLLPPSANLGVVQYFSDVPKFDSIGDILRNYVARAKTLSTHSGTHPPGPVIVLWIFSHLFVHHKMTKAFVIILTAPLVLIPMYLLAKRFYNDGRIANYTLALYLMTPSVIMFTATCMDAYFAVFLVFTIYLFFLSFQKESFIFPVLTGILLGISMLLTFSTTFLGLYFVILTILIHFVEREKFRKYLKVLLISGGTFCAFYLLMYLLTGYNVLACLRGAMEIDNTGSSTHMGCGTGYENLPRYLYISGVNIFAFLTGMGVPVVVLWLREAGMTLKNVFTRKRFLPFLLAYIITLVVITFSTLYTTETERIWMFMAPFFLIPSAKNLVSYMDNQQNEWIFYAVVVMLYAQTLVLEVILNTLW